MAASRGRSTKIARLALWGAAWMIGSTAWAVGSTVAAQVLPIPAQTPAGQQAPDNVTTEDTLAVRLAGRDSLGLIPPTAPAAGRPVTPVPALTRAITVEALLAEAPGAFGIPLGTPGRWLGVSVDGALPASAGLRLDGRDATSLFTGHADLGLLPIEITDRVRRADPVGPSAVGWVTTTRPFRLARPITELKYGAGRAGVQQVSATHAQTRRAPGRWGGGDARVTGAFHVASRRARSALRRKLRHTQVMGGLMLLRPGASLHLQNRYADRTVGVRPFGEEAGAERGVLRNDAAATLRLGLVGDSLAAEPTTLRAGWTRERLRLGLSGDTLAAAVDRFDLAAEQSLDAGVHHLSVRAVGAWTSRSRGMRDPFGGPSRWWGEVVLTDSVRLGMMRVAADVGGAVSARVAPRLGLDLTLGGAYLRAAWTGGAAERLRASTASSYGVPGNSPGEAAQWAELGLRGRKGVMYAELRGWLSRAVAPRVLQVAADAASPATAVLQNPIERVGTTLAFGLRTAFDRGLYLTGSSTIQYTQAAETPRGQRLAKALPQAYGRLRFGIRAERRGTSLVRLDVFAEGRAWSPFEALREDPLTGLPVLPEASVAVPARASLDVTAEARFADRAVVFVTYENVLGGSVFDRVTLSTPDEAPAPALLRFGIFWALLD